MTLTLHDDLPAILESLQAEPGLEALEERVLEAGHLEEDDYGLLLEKRVRGAAHSNLRHHILFCELCATEFLRRLAPVAEAEFLAAALRKKRRRRF